MTDYFSMPDVLPEKLTGWTKILLVHFSFGGGKGARKKQRERTEVLL